MFSVQLTTGRIFPSDSDGPLFISRVVGGKLVLEDSETEKMQDCPQNTNNGKVGK